MAAFSRENQRATPVRAEGHLADYKTGLERVIANGRHRLDEGGGFSRSSRTPARLFAWLRAAIEKGRPLFAGDPRPGSK
jgi:hypothetical protein